MRLIAILIVSWLANTESDLAGYLVHLSDGQEQIVQTEEAQFESFPSSGWVTVQAFDASGNFSEASEPVYFQVAQNDTVIWDDTVPIKILIERDSQGVLNYKFQWKQSNAVYPGRWNDLIKRINPDSTDYSTAGDTLIVNTRRLMEFNRYYSFWWNFRIVVNDTSFYELPETIRPQQFGRVRGLRLLR